MNEAFIRGIRVGEVDDSIYPFSIPAIKNAKSLDLSSSVTFLVGENGSGKSTLAESIAVAAGFNAEGGTKNYSFSTQDTTSSLTDSISLIRGTRREKYGYFLRAEVSTQQQTTPKVERMALEDRYLSTSMVNIFMNNHMVRHSYLL